LPGQELGKKEENVPPPVESELVIWKVLRILGVVFIIIRQEIFGTIKSIARKKGKTVKKIVSSR